MKRSMMSLLIVTMVTTGSLFASGQADVTSVSTTKDKVEYAAADSVEVEASADILALFEDNDDNDLYEETFPFLTGAGKSRDMTNDMNEYVSYILKDDTDDIMDLIRDELTAPLKSGLHDESFMVLGNYKAAAKATEPLKFYISVEKMSFEPVKTSTVEPSSDILAVFEDNDDDLYGSALPFLAIGSNFNGMDQATIEYLENIILDDTDDITDLVKSELKAALTYGGVEESTMVLGNYRFTAAMEDKGFYTYKIEELEYEPVKSVQILPTSDILAVFEDNDDDDLYSKAITYLNSGVDFSDASIDVLDYIDEIVEDDTDDLSDLIREELNKVLVRGDVEGAYMVIGDYVFTSALNFII